jgi:hypothetical protein
MLTASPEESQGFNTAKNGSSEQFKKTPGH